MSQPLRKKTYVSFISLALTLVTMQLTAQDAGEKKDSVDVPLNIKVGVDILGPAMYMADRNILSTEAYLAADLNEKMGISLGGGISEYRYTQYNYDYRNQGFYMKAGIDLNLLKPEVSRGKYWGGIGLRYGLSSFTYEVPEFSYENYWGQSFSKIEKKSAWGHYIEISPGFRARIFSNLSMGWSVHLRRLLFTGTGKDLRPIYFPGFGKGDQPTSSAISYYLVWNINYKTIRVKIKTDEPASPDQQPAAGQSGSTQQNRSNTTQTPARNTQSVIK